MLNNYQNFIFDLDGTIVNSSEEVLNCFRYAFKKTNIPIDENRFTSNVIGPPLYDIVLKLAPNINDDNKINEIIDYYNSIYNYDENDISFIYDGILDILNNLKNQNKKLFIATYKPTTATMRILKKFKLDMFDDIYTIDKFGNEISKTKMLEDIILKYNLKKSDTVMLGDAKSDVVAAKEAGVFAVGVLWGYGTDKSGLIENADLVLKSVNDIINLNN